MGKFLRLGLSTLIWVAQLVALAILVICCITSPVFSNLGLSKHGGITYGVFGYCSAGSNCSKVQAIYHPERMGGQGWSLGHAQRSALSNILIATPVAAGLTFIALLLNFVSQLRVASSNAGMFVINLVLTVFSLLVTTLAVVVVWVLFSPHLTWCSYLLIVAGALHLLCVPLTYLAHLEVMREARNDDEASFGSVSGGRKGLLKEDEFRSSFNMNDLQKDAYNDEDVKATYYNSNKLVGSTNSESIKTDFSETYAASQPVQQKFLRPNQSNPSNPNEQITLAGTFETHSADHRSANAPYPNQSTVALSSTTHPTTINESHVNNPAAPYPLEGATYKQKPRDRLYGLPQQPSQQQQRQTLQPLRPRQDQQPVSAMRAPAHKVYNANYSAKHPSQPYPLLNGNYPAEDKYPYATRGTPTHNLSSLQGDQQYDPINLDRSDGFGLFNQSSSNFEGKRSDQRPPGSNYATASTNIPVAGLSDDKSVPKESSAHNSFQRTDVYSAAPQDYDDEEFVRQNTIDPHERPPVEDDDGIKDDGSDFTSVSQRGINPIYYVAKNPSYPGQSMSAPMSPQQRMYYNDPKFGPQNPAYQQAALMQQVGSPQYLGQCYTPQQRPLSGLFSTPLGQMQRAPNTSDILLQNNPDFMVGGGPATTNTPKFGNMKRSSQLQSPTPTVHGTHYKPAYKKRLQKTTGISAASLSKDSPYSSR